MESKTVFARALRQSQTPAEAKLWQALRSGRLDGLKFRRQHPITPYVVDFSCEGLMLVVELDGGVRLVRAPVPERRGHSPIAGCARCDP